ncbi:hypothetical protein Salat_2986100 [Sesamum alatum]|uniref:Uncharacterized protein n=1 Tax=Sesamum alatum TaxID=300844 RepID=A0AAE1XI65_9LAMI|nr:hypothetical protein Salat_2986100 [Sesamum alatum]
MLGSMFSTNAANSPPPPSGSSYKNKNGQAWLGPTKSTLFPSKAKSNVRLCLCPSLHPLSRWRWKATGPSLQRRIKSEKPAQQADPTYVQTHAPFDYFSFGARHPNSLLLSINAHKYACPYVTRALTIAWKVEKKEGEECAEIGNMTRAGRCFKPDHLRTTEGPRKGESSRERPSNRGLSQGSQESLAFPP